MTLHWGDTPIFLGGDHTLSSGSVNALARHWQERGRELRYALARRLRDPVKRGRL